MNSIAQYSSGREMANQVLGDLFPEAKTKDSNGSGSVTSGSGRINGMSFIARLVWGSNASAQRATCKAIQEKLEGKNSKIAQAFGKKFWFSKMMGRPISKDAVIRFLDPKIKEEHFHTFISPMLDETPTDKIADYKNPSFESYVSKSIEEGSRTEDQVEALTKDQVEV